MEKSHNIQPKHVVNMLAEAEHELHNGDLRYLVAPLEIKLREATRRHAEEQILFWRELFAELAEDEKKASK